MKVIRTAIPEVLLLEPQVFKDARGEVFESFNRRTFASAAGIDFEFVQDNVSRSAANVLRGLHYQVKQPQGKLVWTARGEIFDVAVDLRRSSPTFGRWVGFSLSESAGRMAWIPPGFAHGLLVLSPHAEVLYKMTAFYAPEHERALLWNDPDVAIAWPLDGRKPILSAKDQNAKRLRDAETFA